MAHMNSSTTKHCASPQLCQCTRNLACQTRVHHDLPNSRQRHSEKPWQSEPRTTHIDPCGEKVPKATCDHSATVIPLVGHLLQGLRQPKTFCQQVSLNLLIKGTGGFPVAKCQSLHVHDVGTSQPPTMVSTYKYKQ